MGEVVAFPGIQRHLPGRHRPARPGKDIVAHMLMEGGGHRIQRRCGGDMGDRRAIALPRRQPDLAGLEPVAQMQQMPSVVEPVERNQMIAARPQMRADDRPFAVEQALPAEDHAGETIM